jgi:tRNA threonylcarbamoyladenosine biosynthesis protein TsaE
MGDVAPSPVVVDAESPEGTRAAATRLACLLQPGDVLCLEGDLGAGKTTFIQGLAAALDVPGQVTSPTFTLVQEYHGGRLPLYHFDVYRLAGPRELTDLGFEDYLRAEGVVVIEWASRVVAALPDDRLEVLLEEMGDGEEEARRITFRPYGQRWAGFATVWEEKKSAC